MCAVFANVCEEIWKIKQEMQNIAKAFKRKVTFGKISTLCNNSLVPIVHPHAKSTSLKILSESLLGSLNSLSASLDIFHDNLSQAKSALILKSLDHTGATKNLKLNVLTVQKKNIGAVQGVLEKLHRKIDKAPVSLPY